MYFINRILLLIVTSLGISFVCFGLTRILPGGPVEQAIQRMSFSGGDTAKGVSVPPAEVERLKRIYGFDKPFLTQYFSWLWGIVRGDFGDSYTTYRPVLQEIASKIPISLTFGLTGFILSYLICIPLGIKKALHNNTKFDTISSIIIYAGYSVPGFAMGILLLVFLGGGSFLDLFPLTDIVSDNHEFLPWYGKIFDYAHHMILPVFCYTIQGFAVLTILMKNSLIDELNKDYIRTSIAKGQSYRVVVFKHALRNALIPITTGIGTIFSVFFAGSILIEKVFTIPGMGLLSFNAINGSDYTVVLGIVMIASAVNLLGRLFSDIMLIVVDPRIKL